MKLSAKLLGLYGMSVPFFESERELGTLGLRWALVFVGVGRNLGIDGGYEICAEMYNKGILEPLKTFIPKVSFPSPCLSTTSFADSFL